MSGESKEQFEALMPQSQAEALERREAVKNRLLPYLTQADATRVLDSMLRVDGRLGGVVNECAVMMAEDCARSARFYLVAWPDKAKGKWDVEPGMWDDDAMTLPSDWRDPQEWWLGKV